jgi:DNA-binding XRE family transcriptional regulator
MQPLHYNLFMPKITRVEYMEGFSLCLTWEQGRESLINLEPHISAFKALAPLRNLEEFRQVRTGEWGWHLEWPCGADISSDTLRRLALEQAKNIMTPTMFKEWRQGLGLSLTQAAHILGLSRRMVAYYESGEKAIPKYVALACMGASTEIGV